MSFTITVTQDDGSVTTTLVPDGEDLLRFIPAGLVESIEIVQTGTSGIPAYAVAAATGLLTTGVTSAGALVAATGGAAPQDSTLTIGGLGVFTAGDTVPVNSITVAGGTLRLAIPPLDLRPTGTPGAWIVDDNSAHLAALIANGQPLDLSGKASIGFVDGTLSTGTPTPEAVIARLYHGLLGRGPDSAGFASFETWLAAGQTTLAGAAQILLGSAEFAARHGTALTDAQFVAPPSMACSGAMPPRPTWLNSGPRSPPAPRAGRSPPASPSRPSPPRTWPRTPASCSPPTATAPPSTPSMKPAWAVRWSSPA